MAGLHVSGQHPTRRTTKQPPFCNEIHPELYYEDTIRSTALLSAHPSTTPTYYKQNALLPLHHLRIPCSLNIRFSTGLVDTVSIAPQQNAI